MSQIILNNDQFQAVRQAIGNVEVLDPSGVLVGYMTRPPMATPEEIAEARRRLNTNGPWHTTAEVLRHLQALEQG